MSGASTGGLMRRNYQSAACLPIVVATTGTSVYTSHFVHCEHRREPAYTVRGMRVLSRLTLQTKVLLMQVGIVLLVAGLIAATVLSVLARMVEQQTGGRALGVAHAVTLM